MGLNPGQIHVHVRRFKVADLPRDEDRFSTWLQTRWQEKDDLLDHFYKKDASLLTPTPFPRYRTSRSVTLPNFSNSPLCFFSSLAYRF
ncbi:hypothetical protein L0F63_002167 [Massospora cicadina]|nr:hypothetical protein L0F63_002167 [Massospora cicadina]